MRDLSTGFTYRSAWTGYARGRGLNVENAPVLHSANLDPQLCYEDPFKGPRNSFSKKYEQFIEALRTSKYALVRHGGKDENGKLFGSGKLIALYEIVSSAIDDQGGVRIQLGQRIAG